MNYFSFPIQSALSAYIPRPQVSSSTNFFYTDKTEFHLTCHGEIYNDVAYQMVFMKDGEILKTNEYVEISDMEHAPGNRRASHLNLTVKEADKGIYSQAYIPAKLLIYMKTPTQQSSK